MTSCADCGTAHLRRARLEYGRMFLLRKIISLSALVCVGVFLLMFWRSSLEVSSDEFGHCDGHMCQLYVFLRDFQPLIGSAVAISAAYIAALPVWKQLAHLRLQQDIMARDHVARRLKGMEARTRQLNDQVGKWLDDAMWAVYEQSHDDELTPRKVDAHWAHNAHFDVWSICEKLKAQQNLRQDTHEIEVARHNLILAVQIVAELLHSIAAPASLAGDPQVSDTDMEQLEEEEEQARRDLPDATSRLRHERRLFNHAVERELAEIRRWLRAIDDKMLSR